MKWELDTGGKAMRDLDASGTAGTTVLSGGTLLASLFHQWKRVEEKPFDPERKSPKRADDRQHGGGLSN